MNTGPGSKYSRPCISFVYLIYFASDTIGAGGFSGTGDATGGSAGPVVERRTTVDRRALDGQTAGGNAISGNSGSTTSGSVANTSGDGTAVTNMMASTCLTFLH